MNQWVESVKEFMVKFGQPIRHKPSALTTGECFLRVNLIDEEREETVMAMANRNVTETADGIVDAIYVLIGTAIQSGIELDEIFAEVHRTNMAKVGGKVRADGKILKPEGWEPPKIAEIIEKQRFLGTYKEHAKPVCDHDG